MQGVCGALEKCREADDQVVVEKIVEIKNTQCE